MDMAASRAEAVTAARSILEDDESATSDSEDPDEQFSDEMSSSPSVPDVNDIDFDHVYALHTFLATVEGQASVSKGDNLTLLDDTNSYWWLVRVLKTQAVGYIPAENIETPFERLARLNKHRNVNISSATQQDHATGSGSAQARSRVIGVDDIHSLGTSPPHGSRSVAFAAPTYYEHSDDDLSEDPEGDSESNAEESEHDHGSVDASGIADSLETSDRPDLTERSMSPACDEDISQQNSSRRILNSLSRPSMAHSERSPDHSLRTASSTAMSSGPALDSDHYTEIRKVTLTPNVTRDVSPDPARPDVADPAQLHSQQGTRELSQRQISLGTVHSAHGNNDLTFAIGNDGREQRKSQKPPSPELVLAVDDAIDAKKKKSGHGILGVLFRKKERNRTEMNDGIVSPTVSSLERQIPSPLEKQLHNDSEDEYLADVTHRQQQIEARQALYAQYGISRSAGDESNTLNPRGTSLSQIPTPVTALDQSPSRPLRPGSLLLGSPNASGEVPILNVMRIFAGEDLGVNMTFKTVLLHEKTTAGELLRQALQRFRISILEVDKYSLSIKDQATGESFEIGLSENPLKTIERLNKDAKGVPFVRRSSIGSISSVASNLSLNPAIERLALGDYSDDSAVKLILHSRTLAPKHGVSVSDQSDATIGVAKMPQPLHTNGSPSLHFMSQFIIHRQDLPPDGALGADTSATDLETSPTSPEACVSAVHPNLRQCSAVLHTSTSVAEAIEIALDRFGIVDGVVYGGDEVEERMNKRRNSSRVRYCLTSKAHNLQEVLLPLKSRLLDAYEAAPSFIRSDHYSQDLRRRSSENATFIAQAEADTIFVLRNYSLLAERDQKRAVHRDALAQLAVAPTDAKSTSRRLTSDVSAETANELVLQSTEDVQRRANIAAQRAACRASQRAILSSTRNGEYGVDIHIDNQAMLRSSRILAGAKIRYSYIDRDGATYDVSDIIKSEWHSQHSTSGNKASGLQVQPRSHDLLASALHASECNLLPPNLLAERVERIVARIETSSTRTAEVLSEPDASEKPHAIPTPTTANLEHTPDQQPQLAPTSRPIYRFDESIRRISDIVTYQAAPVEASDLLQALAEQDALDRFFGPSLTTVQTSCIRRWFGATVEHLDVLDTKVDDLLKSVLQL